MLLRLATRSESCDRARIELKKLALALVHAWVVMFADSVPCGTRDLHESRSGRGPAAMRQVDKAEAQQIRPRARCFRNPTHATTYLKAEIEMEIDTEMDTEIEILMEIGTEIDIDVDTDKYIAVANVATAQPRPSAAV